MYNQIIASLMESYDRAADEREGDPLDDWKIEERGWFLDFLRQEGRHTLLEIGAGTGKDSLFFQQSGLDVVCTDLSPEMVRRCRAKGLTAHQMDFLHLDFPAGSFDAVYGLNCLLHVPKADLPAVLSAIHGLLQPGGVFFLGVYGGYDFEGVWEKDRYQPPRFFSLHTDEQMQAAVASHFEMVSFKSVPLPDDDTGMHFQSMILRRG